MSASNQQIINLLKNISLFNGLDDVELDRVAADVHPITLKEGETLPIGGKESPLYLVAMGKARYTVRKKRDDGQSWVLRHGDFIGADQILRGRPQAFNLVAMKPTLLFSFQPDSLRLLLNSFPVLTQNIKKQLSWYNLVRSKPFDWLGEEETVKVICRKHPAYLLVVEFTPLVIAWIGIAIILAASQIAPASFRLAVGWFGAAMVGGAALWAVWRYFDWGNDYYVVTDERVVWLERTLGLYDSRQEAPLVAIKSGETKSGPVGRMMGFGDIVIETFMGQVFFRHIGTPQDIKNLIDQERQLAIERQAATDIHAIEGKIRQKIEPSTAETVPMTVSSAGSPVIAGSSTTDETRLIPEKLNIWQSLLARFQTRREVNGIITYRKHLYVLFRMTLFPAVCVAGLVFGTGLLAYWRSTDQIKLFSPGTIILFGFMATGMVALWWLYKFVDWSNDIYRVTTEKIIDSERKPLGAEITKSAPLENIIGLDYEKLGFLGVVLNFGNVIINIGTENKFIFYGIHNPARAQKDIFNYMQEYRRKKQMSVTTQEQERVSNYLAAYHRQVEELRQSRKPPQF